MLKKLSDHPTAGLIGLCWMNAGSRNVYNSKKPIKSIEDLKGLKIRMMGNPVFVDTMNALGGNGVAMGFDQLDQRHADRRRRRRGEQLSELRERPALSLREILFADRAPDHPGDPGFLQKVWDGLSKDDQALIMKTAEGSATGAAQAVVRDGEGFAQADEGRRRRDQRVADKKPFQDAVKPVWDKYGTQHAALIKRIQDVK